MMIEINRSLYMDEKTGEKISGYQKIKSDLKWVLEKICGIGPDRSISNVTENHRSGLPAG